ncbi:hypothetical protein TNCV_4858371 [Trichonephila clavipes]|nr:hypothetical protein TNCV_4858371 [Trichonephila clavipes]
MRAIGDGPRDFEPWSIFRSELVDIRRGLQFACETEVQFRDVWILTDSPVSVQHLSYWTFIGNQTSLDVLNLLGRIFSNRRVHFQWIPSHMGFDDGDRFNSCQVIYSQFGLEIHQNDHQARRRFVEWAQNEIAVVPDFHKRILFSDEAPFWLNGYVNKQNCRIWSEANPQVYVETPLHPEKLTVWCALWAGGILLHKR